MSSLRLFRLQWLRERPSTSLWIWPVGAISAALVVGFGLPRFDALASAEGWYSFDGKAESARALLSTIATSMLTITGVIFSITILVLQLASSQFSPRVLRTFLRDRTTQAAMAMFLGSFVYALVVLAQVRQAGTHGDAFVPGVSVYAAFASAIIASLMLVRYIHHMAHSIRPAYVLRRIADEACTIIHEQFPHPARAHDPKDERPDGDADATIENVDRGGVLAGVDLDVLFEQALERQLSIVVVPQLGDFVPHGGPLMLVWGLVPHDGAALRECIVLEPERSPRQDPAFGFRQLTDVAERALSPGINDPTTAVQALDHAHDLLRSLVHRELGPLILRDHDARPRVILSRPDWPTFVRLALDEVRHYGRNSIQVAHRIGDLLADLSRIAPPGRRAVLEEQLRLLRAATRESFSDPSDCVLAGLGVDGSRSRSQSAEHPAQRLQTRQP